MALASEEHVRGVSRHFTRPGVHPYDEVEWERRLARIEHAGGDGVAFEQADVEFPVSWSATATNIVAQKYFRGRLGTPERESSLRQVIDRVVDTIAGWGRSDGYFADEAEASTFTAELTWLLLHQHAAFNSPVWFNLGVPGVPPQVSACFILAVDDSIDSILNWYTEEGKIFKGGSGSGVNLSRIRSSREHIRGGGTASGPVSFMRGADASAGTIKSGGKTRRAAKMVLLDADHPDIFDFIWCKAREERKARALGAAGFDVSFDAADYFSVQYQNANNSVRVDDAFMEAVERDEEWDLVARTTGEVLATVPARRIFREIAEAAWECADPGLQFTSTIDSWHTVPAAGPITASNPCSEFVHLDNTSCNLASLNLLSFLDEEGRFDVAGFWAAVDVVFTAQEIMVGRAHYPTTTIGDQTRRFRPLGLGYANLGAALMAQGLPYDSDHGRAWAAGVTALMTGAAYLCSARMAGRLGPFDGYEADRANVIRVLHQHRDALAAIDAGSVPSELLEAATSAWDRALEAAQVTGVRNAQATVLAPTGTISFMMDCDTTGIEPDLGLLKRKRLAGGGTISLVNRGVPRALRRLGYGEDDVDAIGRYVGEHGTIVGAPAVDPAHLAVFACSMGDNVIHHRGHLRMMAVVQPFLSGAISKTVNVPETVAVGDIEDVFTEAWRLGLKAVAVYRDNCKVGQPLSVAPGTGAMNGDQPSAAASPVLRAAVLDAEAPRPVREQLPRQRRSRTVSFRVADCHGFMTVGEYADGRPGEIFLKVAKQGSTLAGIMDAFAISVSHGLQYGVPLRAYIEAFVGVRFEPAGITDDPELRLASSLVDFIFRRLALDYLPVEERVELGIFSSAERLEPPLPGLDRPDVHVVGIVDPPPARAERGGALASPGPRYVFEAPLCSTCGDAMIPAGACFACPSCGSTSGCS